MTGSGNRRRLPDLSRWAHQSPRKIVYVAAPTGPYEAHRCRVDRSAMCAARQDDCRRLPTQKVHPCVPIRWQRGHSCHLGKRTAGTALLARTSLVPGISSLTGPKRKWLTLNIACKRGSTMLREGRRVSPLPVLKPHRHERTLFQIYNGTDRRSLKPTAIGGHCRAARHYQSEQKLSAAYLQ